MTEPRRPGRPRTRPLSELQQVNVRLPRETAAALDAEQERTGQYRWELVDAALRRYLKLPPRSEGK